jgi:IS5 family transposase
MDDAVWDSTVFSKNRDRLLAADVAALFFQRVLDEAKAQDLVSDEHFTVDGTLLEAWASAKSFKTVGTDDPPAPDDPGNPTVDFHGETRTNATHASTTDPDARMARKGAGKEAKLSYSGHVLMENRHGLVVDAVVNRATGTAERDAAFAMAAQIPGDRRVTIGGDKNYDTAELVEQWRGLHVTPHVAQNNKRRRSAIDERTTRHPGYLISQQKRKRVEEIFGWLKTVGGLRKLRHRGLERVGWMFTFGVAAYNLVRMRNLTPAES